MQAVYIDDKKEKKQTNIGFIFIYIKRYLNAKKNTALCFNQFFIVFSPWCLGIFKLILHVLLLFLLILYIFLIFFFVVFVSPSSSLFFCLWA